VVLIIRIPDGPNLSWRSLVLEAPRCGCREPGCVLSQVIRRSISYGVLRFPHVCHWRKLVVSRLFGCNRRPSIPGVQDPDRLAARMPHYGTHARAIAATEGDTTVTQRGQGQRHLDVSCATKRNRLLSGFRMTFLGTPPRSCAASPPSTSPAMRQPNFALP
jgi:hypothetical protein